MDKCPLQRTCLIQLVQKEHIRKLNEKLKNMQDHIEHLNSTLDYLITNYKNDKKIKYRYSSFLDNFRCNYCSLHWFNLNYK